MRFSLTLNINDQGLLPINYQHELSSWIYSVIGEVEKEYAVFLNDKGLPTDHNAFKHFCFSSFHSFRYERFDDRFRILSPQIKLDIAFSTEETAEAFLMRGFQNQRFVLGDRITQVALEVVKVSPVIITVERPMATLQVKSPLVITNAKQEDGSSSALSTFLAPDHPLYSHLFFKNLKEKALHLGVEMPSFNMFDCVIEPIGTPPKSRLITLKAYTPEETHVRGFVYRFRLTAPIPLIELGLETGFGYQNMQGFGFCDKLD